MSTRRRCLLLGAGFSVDAGMPMVSALTKTFVAALNMPGNNQALRHRFKSIFNPSFRVISDPGLNYEDMLGWLQLSQGRFEHRTNLQHYSGLRQVLTEIVYVVLLQAQNISHASRPKWVDKYRGFQKLVTDFGTTHIFSLNHDMVIEDICEHFKIPVHDGFTGDRAQEVFTCNGASVPFSVFTLAEMKSGKLNMPRDGHHVNLYKVHGGLDYFSLRDESQLARVNLGSVGANIAALSKLTNPPAEGLPVANEAVVKDQTGQVQFLRRVHVAGTYKFDLQRPQNQSEEWLKRFTADINFAEDLVVIGYSFGDAHINAAIRNWIEHNTKRILHVVNPASADVPAGFRHFHEQVIPIQKTTHEYLETYT